jgi:dihydrodipicolinate reductase
MITCSCDPVKVSDCASTDINFTVPAGLSAVVYVAQTTVDMRRAAYHSAVCLSAAVPLTVQAFEEDNQYEAVICRLALYRSPARAAFDFSASSLVSEAVTISTFYPDSFMIVTPQLVASGPADMYTAVLSLEPFVVSPNFSIGLSGSINLTATIKSLPST